MPLQIIGQSPLPLERFASMRTRASACVRACVRRAQGSADSGTLRASCIRIYIYIYIPLVQVGVAHPRKSPFLWDWCTRRYYDCPFLPPLLSPPLFSSFGEERGRRNRLSYPLRFPADLGCTEARTSNGTSIGRTVVVL